MSSLYSISVVRVEGDEVDLDVTVVHPDAGPVPDNRTFALRAIWDPINGYHYGREPSVKSSPLAKEMDLDNYLDEGFIDKNARGFIKGVRYISHDNHPPPRWNAPNYETFWDNDEACSAVIRIQATHPGWVAHMRVGMNWDTAAYGTGEGKSWRGPKRSPGDYIEEVAQDPMAGMRAVSVNEANKDRFQDAQVSDLILPLHGAKQYTTRGEELRGDALTLEAARAMLGQPVLVQSEYELQVGTIINVNEGGWLLLYHEHGGGYGSRGHTVSELEFIGRAWHVKRIPIDSVEP